MRKLRHEVFHQVWRELELGRVEMNYDVYLCHLQSDPFLITETWNASRSLIIYNTMHDMRTPTQRRRTHARTDDPSSNHLSDPFGSTSTQMTGWVSESIIGLFDDSWVCRRSITVTPSHSVKTYSWHFLPSTALNVCATNITLPHNEDDWGESVERHYFW